jgi:DNA-directed RNA polymerase specialized sigma subunit
MATKDEVVDQFIKDASQFAPSAQAKYEEYRGRRGAEVELWQKWKDSGKQPEHLEPLLKSMQPLITSETAKRMKGLGGSIPRAALENELRNAAVRSLHNYDPARAALSTHVTRGFQRVSGFVNANRNAKYTPSDDMKKYQRFTNATDELSGELGRKPTPEELAERLPWSVKTISKLQRSFGPEVHTDMGDGLASSEDAADISPRDAFHIVKPELSSQEREFGALYFPPEGEKQPSVQNIAKALGVPAHRAYRLKANVETRVGKVLRRQ